jgi:hypothetical protein
MFRRTIRQVFAYGVSLAKVVDTSVRRVILGLEIPSRVEVLAYPLILEIKLRTAGVRERREGQRKSGEEYIASTHS